MEGYYLIQVQKEIHQEVQFMHHQEEVVVEEEDKKQ